MRIYDLLNQKPVLENKFTTEDERLEFELDKTMNLNEFFGTAVKAGKQEEDKDLHRQSNTDEVFWYIIDHDKLHKDFFHPMKNKIKEYHKSGKLNREECIKQFMPMVEKGCMEYYHKHKMMGKPGKLFPKDMREDLCEKLYDHYAEDIVKGKYD
jgi:hypothetical protein